MSESQPNTQDSLLDDLLGDFLDESDQLLTQLNENLLQLDEWVQSLSDDHQEPCDADLLNEMFRAAHSLKGLSAMLGLTDINTLTHKIENVFDAARNQQLSVNADVVDLVLLGVDELTALVELLKDPNSEPVDCSAVLEGIRQLLHSAGAERKQSSQADAEKAISDTPDTCGPKFIDPFKDLQDEQDLSEKYVAIFIDETEAALDELSDTLLALEGGGDTRQLNSLLVVSHKIKGSAASIGLNRPAKMAHLMEDLLQNLVQAGSVLSSEATDALLACTDALRQYMRQLREGGSAPDLFSQAARTLLAGGMRTSQGNGLAGRLDSVVVEIRRRVAAEDAQTLCSATRIAGDKIEQVRAGGNIELGTLRRLAVHFDKAKEMPSEEAGNKSPVQLDSSPSEKATTFAGRVVFESDLSAAGLKAVLIHEKLAKLGDVSWCEPPAEGLEDVDHLETFSFRIISDEPAESIAEHVRVAGAREVSIEPFVSQTTAPSSEPDQAEQAIDRSTDPGADGRPCAEPTVTSAPAWSDTDAEADTPATQDGRALPADKSTAEQPSSSNKQRSADAASRPTETVRVDIDRLDELMNLAGQLVINKAQFSRIGETLKASLSGKQLTQSLNGAFRELDKICGKDELRVDGAHLRAQACRVRNELEAVRDEVQAVSQARSSVKDLLETIHQFDRVSNAVQQAVMDTRMVPIGPLFSRFNRVVRDIAREKGKDIRLLIRGEKTELDKRMIDELSDPLIHMVRNSADHGIESPDEREKAGKPRQGTVTLDASHRGNSIVIEVSDDGKGLDTDRILRKCLEKGILTEADAEKMTPRQLHQMIWVPGMSTAEKVTGVSGRGMGMDIVKSKIEGLNGIVEIDSTPGRGTTMTIKLPVTLAILPSLMVDIAGNVFAMPMEAVTEIISVGQDCLSTVHGRQMVTVRDRVVSLVRLRDMLSFHGASQCAETPCSQATTLVIVGEAGQEVGLAVDHVIGEEDIVIKSIAENYKNVPGIAGASILGDGRVSLILDIPGLIEMVAKKAATATC
jgi:two-component system chemotaxis sensor kinase CheA